MVSYFKNLTFFCPVYKYGIPLFPHWFTRDRCRLRISASYSVNDISFRKNGAGLLLLEKCTELAKNRLIVLTGRVLTKMEISLNAEKI